MKAATELDDADALSAAVAIGESTNVLPPWAVDACRHFADSYASDVVRFDDPPKAGGDALYSVSDGVLLNEMKRLIVLEGTSVRSAVKRVSEQLS